MSKDIKLIQEDYLYDLNWDVNVVTLFIEVLADQARMGQFCASGNNKHAIQTAQYVVNKFFNTSFDLKVCVKHVCKLRQRHATFSKLMLRDDVFWTSETNTLDCEQETWAQIVKDDPFACAYATHGDPHWEDLQVLFGASSTVAEPTNPGPRLGKEVIQISDDDKGLFVNKFKPLDEVIQISSDKTSSLGTTFWKELENEWNDSDEEGSFRSPSLKTEMSSSNPTALSKGNGKNFAKDNICMSFYGASYVSSSANATPNSKK